ncbi:MAG TPA: zf-HC2 domain-containing protein [Solirubrobacterales bacterium]|jgi:hypothetical protein|nr:zf-HC2 domain-containing protein [Solirubrobacterales bacterium]
MKTESCREWRPSLGVYALGDLPADERAALEAHLEGCEECREEVRSLSGVARLLPYADPAQFTSTQQPSPELGRQIAATIGVERRQRERRRRRRFGFAFSGAVAASAAAAALAIALLPVGENAAPRQNVDFAGLPAGVQIDATLEPHAFGTEIHMYVSGMRSGTLCRVFLRGPNGAQAPAGTFRYRWGDDSEAVLSSALDLSRTTAIGIHAGNRIYIAPVGQTAAPASHT